MQVSDATKLLSSAASEAVGDIAERYEGYHAHLVSRFVEVLRIQHREPGDKARRRAIDELVEAFASEAMVNIGTSE